MRRLLVVFASLLAAILVVPQVAVAKGAESATIDGGGLSAPIVVPGNRGGGDPGQGTPLFKLADQAGFWPAAFGQTPNPMLEGKPTGDLGPSYTISWKLPSPEGGTDFVIQQVYPYAPQGPVTFMPAGQTIFEGETIGGWFQATTSLKKTLTGIGLPSTAPDLPSGSSTSAVEAASPSSNWALVLLIVGLVVAGGATLVVLWRRPRTAAA